MQRLIYMAHPILWNRSRQPIPQGLRPAAQGCEERATLGQCGEQHQPQRGCANLRKPESPPQPRWGWRDFIFLPRVARSSQPWASLRNPCGILKRLPARHQKLVALFCSIATALALTGCVSGTTSMKLSDAHPGNPDDAQATYSPLTPFLMADTNLVVMTTTSTNAPEGGHEQHAKPEAKTPQKHEHH